MARAPRVAEFFAGIGLVRKALESEVMLFQSMLGGLFHRVARVYSS